MARPKEHKDDKSENLKKYGALNPHPQKVAEKMFADSTLEFFDPRDLVQVKYEMLRSVDIEGRSVKRKRSINRIFPRRFRYVMLEPLI